MIEILLMKTKICMKYISDDNQREKNAKINISVLNLCQMRGCIDANL